MKEQNVKIYTVEGVRDFDLTHTFECGQCFRWNRREDGSYTGIAYGKPVNVSINGSTLIIKNAEEDDFNNLWHKYFDLGTNYGQIKERLSAGDKKLAKAIEFGGGIRILKQEKWETLLSFIISQNNNIPRIKGCIEKLCADFGEYVGNFAGEEFYAMPDAKTLAALTESDLAGCRLGYRAKYLIEVSKQITAICEDRGCNCGDLGFLDDMTTAEAYDFLLGLCGVGPKVASCMLLFGLARGESFPIDVWVRKVMVELYGFDEKDVKGMARFAQERFGEYGGIAQQYLFYYMREIN